MSTYLDNILMAPTGVLQSMITSGSDSSAILGNGTLLINTTVANAIAHASVTFNGAPTFNFGTFTCVGVSAPSLQSQSLHLGNGDFTATFTVPAGTITVDTLVLRQAATCALQNLVLPAGSYTHAPTMPPCVIVEGSDQVTLNANGTSVQCMRLRAHSRECSCERLAYIGAYFSSTGVTFNGLNPGSAPFNTFTVATGGGTLSLLHCVAVGDDADNQVARTVSAVLTGCQHDPVKLQAAHSLRWMSMWQAGVTVLPKTPGDPAVADINLALQAAMYRILSVRRDTGRMTISYIPSTWLPWTPSLANALAASVPDASKNAAAESLSATICDLKGATGDVAAPMLERVASGVLDVWNAFRVTCDRSWLRTLSADICTAANFIAQRIEDTGLGSVSSSTVTIPVCSMGASRSVIAPAPIPLTSTGVVTTRLGAIVDTHGVTQNLCKAALSAATQMLYDLRDIPSHEWLSCYNGLVVPISNNAYRYDAASALGSPTNDQVMNCHPLVFYPPASLLARSVLLEGASIASLEASNSDPTIMFGAMSVLAFAAPLDGDPVAAINSVGALYQAVVTAADADLWRTLNSSSLEANIESSAAFISTAVYGFARIRINGLVDRDGVHIQRFALSSEPLVYLPSTWAGMTVTQTSACACTKIVSNII